MVAFLTQNRGIRVSQTYILYEGFFDFFKGMVVCERGNRSRRYLSDKEVQSEYIKRRVLFQLAFNSICKTMRLTSEDVRKNIGSRALQPVGAARLSAWLSQKEDEYRIVLYQSDATLTPWTLRCLRQADCVLIVGYGDEAPDLTTSASFC